MSSDSRRFDGHRAAKGAFQQLNVRASLRRSIEQLRRTPPPSFDLPKPAPARQEAPRA